MVTIYGERPVRGCMSATGIGTLKFIDGIMNHRIYINILKCNLSSSLKEIGIKDNFIFSMTTIQSTLCTIRECGYCIIHQRI